MNYSESQVNHPSHYNINGQRECIDVMQDTYGRLAVYYFDKLNQFKYEYRAGVKDGEPVDKDLAKANWYWNHKEKTYNSFNWFQKLVLKLASFVCK